MAALPNEMSRGRRVAKRFRAAPVHNGDHRGAEDAGKRLAFTAPTARRGERLISPLSAIVYLAHHSGPNMATSAACLREINKSSALLHLCV